MILSHFEFAGSTRRDPHRAGRFATGNGIGGTDWCLRLPTRLVASLHHIRLDASGCQTGGHPFRCDGLR